MSLGWPLVKRTIFGTRVEGTSRESREARFGRRELGGPRARDEWA